MKLTRDTRRTSSDEEGTLTHAATPSPGAATTYNFSGLVLFNQNSSSQRKPAPLGVAQPNFSTHPLESDSCSLRRNMSLTHILHTSAGIKLTNSSSGVAPSCSITGGWVVSDPPAQANELPERQGPASIHKSGGTPSEWQSLS